MTETVTRSCSSPERAEGHVCPNCTEAIDEVGESAGALALGRSCRTWATHRHRRRNAYV